MKKIMFVCMGNICRSPLAHAAFEAIVRREGATSRYRVDSSGTIAYHAGERADERMREVAGRHGVTIDHRAQHLKRHHLDEFDLILCMDRDNLADARRLAKTGAACAKIALLRDYDPEGPGDVPDPYYGGPSGFEEVYAIVSRSCEALFKALEQEP
jgi:protein-tyrosine phosphatase